MSVQIESIGGELYANGKRLMTEDDVTAGTTVLIPEGAMPKPEYIDKAQLATAWVNFDGEASTVDATFNSGFNVSQTINQVADAVYEIVFDIPMDNTDYVVTIGVGNNGTSTVNATGTLRNPDTLKTVNGFTVAIYVTAAYRSADVSITVFGGKA